MYGNEYDDYMGDMGVSNRKLDPIEKIQLGVQRANEEYGIIENNFGINQFDEAGNYYSYDINGFPFAIKRSGNIYTTFSTLYKDLPFMCEEADKQWFKQFNLTDVEINCFYEVIGKIGAINEARLASRYKLPDLVPYYSDDDIELLLLMYDIRKKKSEIESDESLLVKNLNRVYQLRNKNKTSLSKMSRSVFDSFPRKFDRYPRRVEIVGIQDEVFQMYNSENYQKYDKLYSLSEGTNVGSEYVTVITDKVPTIKWRGNKFVEDVCYLTLLDSETYGKDTTNEALYELKINRDYVKFLPTYYIYISTKEEPGIKIDGLVYYLDYYKIIGESGVTLTVAIGVHQLGKHERNKIPSSENVQAVAYYPEEAYLKLIQIAKEVYSHPNMKGFNVEKVKGNCSLDDFLDYSRNVSLSVEEREAYAYEQSHQSHDDEEETF